MSLCSKYDNNVVKMRTSMAAAGAETIKRRMYSIIV